MSTITTRRLALLADKLRSLPRGRFNAFDLSAWLQMDTSHNLDGIMDERGDLKPDLTPKQMNECGATACAFGWACTIPQFRRAGLTLDAGCGVPRFGGQTGYSAAEEFFRVTPDIAEWLFDPEQYSCEDHTRPSAVVKRIERYIANPERVQRLLAA